LIRARSLSAMASTGSSFNSLGTAFSSPASRPSWISARAFHARTFLPMPSGPFARAQHGAGVGLGPSIRPDVPMHVEVGYHAALHERPGYEGSGEIHLLGLVELPRPGVTP
jgi:hypothetical protein